MMSAEMTATGPPDSRTPGRVVRKAAAGGFSPQLSPRPTQTPAESHRRQIEVALSENVGGHPGRVQNWSKVEEEKDQPEAHQARALPAENNQQCQRGQRHGACDDARIGKTRTHVKGIESAKRGGPEELPTYWPASCRAEKKTTSGPMVGNWDLPAMPPTKWIRKAKYPSARNQSGP